MDDPAGVQQWIAKTNTTINYYVQINRKRKIDQGYCTSN